MDEFKCNEKSIEFVADCMVDHFCETFCMRHNKETCNEIDGLSDSLCKKAKGIWDLVIRKEEVEKVLSPNNGPGLREELERLREENKNLNTCLKIDRGNIQSHVEIILKLRYKVKKLEETVKKGRSQGWAKELLQVISNSAKDRAVITKALHVSLKEAQTQLTESQSRVKELENATANVMKSTVNEVEKVVVLEKQVEKLEGFQKTTASLQAVSIRLGKENQGLKAQLTEAKKQKRAKDEAIHSAKELVDDFIPYDGYVDKAELIEAQALLVKALDPQE